ncbi:hypothetical protein Tco_1146715 [Tanacetum coccineum]
MRRTKRPLLLLDVKTGNKASTSGVQEEGKRSTPLVDYSGDQDNEDEIEYVDNEIEVIWLQNRRRLDMEIPDNILSIYDNLDIKIRFSPNNQNDQWELNLDIDDSDLRLTPLLCPCSSTRVETSTTTQKLVRKIPVLQVDAEEDPRSVMACGSKEV